MYTSYTSAQQQIPAREIVQRLLELQFLLLQPNVTKIINALLLEPFSSTLIQIINAVQPVLKQLGSAEPILFSNVKKSK